MRQIEHWQSLTVTCAGASTSKRTAPQWQPPRCVTSAGGSGSAAACISRREELGAVVPQFADRLVNVGLRQVRTLLDEAFRHAGRPAAGQLLERAHIKIAIVEEALEVGHQARQEPPVLADAAAAHG